MRTDRAAWPSDPGPSAPAVALGPLARLTGGRT